MTTRGVRTDINTTADAEEPDGDQCAGVIDGGADDITPVQLWEAVMKKYKVAQECEAELARLAKSTDSSKKDQLLRDRSLAVATAVEALTKLHHQETLSKLQDFVRRDKDVCNELTIVHANEFLSSRNPLFWCSCFMRLFPRGDCAERCPQRSTPLPSWRWAKCLLTRFDSCLWRQNVEFIASLYNVFLRRDQINAVEASIRGSRLSQDTLGELQKLTSTGHVHS